MMFVRFVRCVTNSAILCRTAATPIAVFARTQATVPNGRRHTLTPPHPAHGGLICIRVPERRAVNSGAGTIAPLEPDP